MRLALRVLVALAALLLSGCITNNLFLASSSRTGRPGGWPACALSEDGAGSFSRPNHAGVTSPALSARAACSCLARAGFFRTTAGTAG